MSTNTKTQRTAKPSIVIRKTDHDRLTQLANGLIERRPELAEELLNELERARVVGAQSVPVNTVQMGSTVEFSSDADQTRRVTLVYPAEADIAEGKVSILTPIGTALLGLSVGQAIDFLANDGRKHRLTVLSVEPAAPTAA